MKVPDKLNEYTDTEEALKMIISSDIDNMINWNDYHISGDIEEIKKIVRAHGIINVGVDDLICTMSTTNTNYVTTGKGRGSKRVLIALKQAIERLSVKLQDIEKCFNYLDGDLTEAVDLEESLNFAEEYGETKNIQLKYFTVTFYKKGTCHITFNNDELLKKFNIFGSQHKGWLPPSYGKKSYNDMTTEEKAVVNEFEGEKEYNKVVSNKEYYLFDGNNLNLLEEKTA